MGSGASDGACVGARDIAGRNIRIGRVPVSGNGGVDWVNPGDADDWWITGVDRRDRASWDAVHNEVAFSLQLSPDGSNLFVTTGRLVKIIDTETFTRVAPWSNHVESPCRLVRVVTGATRGSWTVTVLQGRHESNDNGVTSGEYSLRTFSAPSY